MTRVLKEEIEGIHGLQVSHNNVYYNGSLMCFDLRSRPSRRHHRLICCQEGAQIDLALTVYPEDGMYIQQVLAALYFILALA